MLLYRMQDLSGVQYYSDLLSRLKTDGIEVIVDLYHHDLPLDLQDTGGWTNQTTIDEFVNHANTCFALYGQYVGHWITIASPLEEVTHNLFSIV